MRAGHLDSVYGGELGYLPPDPLAVLTGLPVGDCVAELEPDSLQYAAGKVLWS